LVAKAETKTVPVTVRAIGSVQATASVAVRAQVGGPLTAVLFQEGQQVKQGDLLFTIDRRPYENALAQAQAVYQRDTDQSTLMSKEAAMVQELFQQGMASRDTYDRARNAANAQAAAVRADRALLETVRLQLSYCRIVAPIAGKAGQLLVDPGNLVRANDATLVVINQISPIDVDFSAPEQQLSEIRKHMARGSLPVEAYLPGEVEPESGELAFVDNAVDQATGTILLRASFPNKSERLWPGLYVDVALTLTELTGAVVIPSRALQTGQQGQFVFTVKPDRTVEVVPVTPGLSLGEETVITTGLAPGAVVVTDGQLRLTPGAKVTVKSGLSEAGAARP
jgi:multidrug efflux system membrane fusion protein